MKKLLPALLGLAMAVGLMAQTTPPQGIIDKTPQLKAYVNARIVVSPDETIENGTLVIDRGKIIRVGPGLLTPPGATEIDLDGKSIYPGFIDPYTEYGLDIESPPRRQRNDPPVYDAERVGCNASNGAIHAEQNWVDLFEPDHTAAEKFRDLGFTSVQSAHLDGVFRGRGFVTSLGNGLPNDLVIRPHTWHFLGFTKGSSPQEYPESLMGAIALIRQTLIDADWYQKAHSAYANNTKQEKPEVNLALAALENITNERVVVDADARLNIFRADRIGTEFGLDIVLVGGEQAYENIDAIKATGRTLILTIDFPEAPEVGSLEDELDVSLAQLRRWDWGPSNPALLEQAGVRFALTTHGLDKMDDFAANLRLAIERGLSKKTALAALTTIPAELCGVDDMIGTLEAGKLADFVICDGDIFDEETRLFSVVTGGELHELIPLTQVSFAGYYEAGLAGRKIGLKLTDTGVGDERELSGKFMAGETTVDLDNVCADLSKISFAAPLDSLGSEGIARFSLRKDESVLAGKVAYADGSLVSWSATVAEEPPAPESDTAVDESEKSDTPKRESETDDNSNIQPISRLTFPNMAYGFERLPRMENVLVTNGTVWTSEDDGILQNADLLIENGLITAVGVIDLETLSGVRVIDATGKHVTAGIIDEHSHISISGDVNEGTDAITSETRIGDVIRDDDISVYRSLAGGVIATRTAHGSANPIGAQQQVIKLRWGSLPEAMKADEAPPAIKFALGENVTQVNWGDQYRIRYPQSRMGVETIIRDIFQAAREYEVAWETYRRLNSRERDKKIPPRRNLRLEAIVGLLDQKTFIDCHAYVQSEILMLMRLAEQFGITVTTFVHILEGYKVADEMAKHGAMGGSIPDWWAYKYEVYDAIPHGPAIMAEHGVTVSINSDSRHLQRLLNQAAAKSVQYADMSQEEAWKMVTLNPAKQLKAEKYLGSLKPGKDADFVIWSGNPLSIYSRVEQTWIDGARYFDVEQDAVMQQEVVQEKNRLIQKILDNPAKKKRGKSKGDRGPYEYQPGGDEKGVQL